MPSSKKQRRVGAIDGFERADEAVVLGRRFDAALAPQPRGVDEAQRAVFGLDDRVDRIPCCSRHVVDHGTILADEPVEERRLANVRPADDGDAEDPVVFGLGLVLRCFRQRVDDGVEQLARQAAVDRGDGHRLPQPEAREVPEVGFATLVVDLVRNDDRGRVRLLQQTRDARVLLGDAGRDVDDQQHEIGRPGCFGGLLAHLGRELRLLAREAGVALGEPAAGVDDR